MDWPAVAEGRARLARRAGVDPERVRQARDAAGPARSRGAWGAAEAELDRLLAACGAVADPPLLAELVAMETDVWRRATSLFPDVPAGLARLRGAGCRLAIVSNCSWPTRPALERMGLDREVDAVVLSFEAGVVKPERGIFELALDRVAAGPGDAAFVDDVAGYLDAARDLGLRTVRMDRTGAPPTGGHPVAADLPEAARVLGA